MHFLIQAKFKADALPGYAGTVAGYITPTGSVGATKAQGAVFYNAHDATTAALILRRFETNLELVVATVYDDEC